VHCISITVVPSSPVQCISRYCLNVTVVLRGSVVPLILISCINKRSCAIHSLSVIVRVFSSYGTGTFQNKKGLLFHTGNTSRIWLTLMIIVDFSKVAEA
jgi:hypothetical protein